MVLEHNEIELEEHQKEGIQAQLTLKRVKKHYFENYSTRCSATPDKVEPARRGSTHVLFGLWRRAVFAVQYDDMTAEAVTNAFALRRSSG